MLLETALGISVAGVLLLLAIALAPDVFGFSGLVALLWLRTAVDGAYNFQIGPVSATDVSGLVIGVVGVGYLLRGRAASVPIMLLVALVFASSFLVPDAPDAAAQVEALRFSIQLLAVAIAASASYSGPRSEAVILALQGCGIICGLAALAQILTSTGLLIEGVVRYPGTMAHPNSAVLVYAVAATATVARCIHTGARKRDLALLIGLVGCAVSTGSIGGMTTVLAMMGLFVLTTPHTRVSRLGMTLGSAIVGAAFVLSPVGQARVSEFQRLDLALGAAETNSFEWRVARWREVLALSDERRLLGMGYGTSADGQFLNGYPPHSEYVRFLVEVGIVGLIVAFVSVAGLMVVLWRMRNGGSVLPSLAIAILGGLLLNAVADNTFLYTVPCVMAAVAVGAAIVDGRQASADPDANRRLNANVH